MKKYLAIAIVAIGLLAGCDPVTTPNPFDDPPRWGDGDTCTLVSALPDGAYYEGGDPGTWYTADGTLIGYSQEEDDPVYDCSDD